MRKTVIAAVILLILGTGLLIAGIANFSRFSAYLISRAVDSTVTVGGTKLSRKGTMLMVSLSDIRSKGKINAHVGNCVATVDIFHGISINEISVSNFEITVEHTPTGGNPFRYVRPFNYPLRFASIRKGVVFLPDQMKILLDDVEARNMNVNGPASIKATIRVDQLGSFHIVGNGTYNRKLIDMRGDISYRDLAVNHLYKVLHGSARGKGTFSLKKDRFDFNGKAEADQFKMEEKWLKKPLEMDKAAADVSFSAEGEIVKMNIENALYKKTPFALAIVFKQYRYVSLEMNSGFLGVQDVTSYATSDYSLQQIWDVLENGQVKLSKLRHEKNGAMMADLTFKDVSATYEEMFFDNIAGEISLDNSRAQILGLKGSYKKSRFYDAKGNIPYQKNIPVNVSGKYVLELTDIPPIIDLRGIIFESGKAEGTAGVQGKGGQTLEVSGSGTLTDARVRWKNTPFSADGPFRFSDQTITSDALQIRKDNTSIMCKGTLDGTNLNFGIKGILEPKHLNEFVKIPFESGGTVMLDGRLLSDGDILRGSGVIDMVDLTFEVPGYVKKNAGMKSSAFINVYTKGADITVEDLTYSIENINVRGSGTISGKKLNANIQANAPDLTKVTEFFLLSENLTGGNLSLNIAVRDLEFPIKKLPYLTGNLKIEKGYVQVPNMTNPLRDIDLSADFRGEFFTANLDGLTCGGSKLAKATFTLNDLERPMIAANIEMERLNPAYFSSLKRTVSGIPVFPSEGVFARSSADVTLKVSEFIMKNVNARDLHINVTSNNRIINFTSIRAALFDGSTAMSGTLDLTGTVPKLAVNGRMSRMQSDLLLVALGGTAKDLTGTAFVNGNLTSEGKNMNELAANMSGTVSLYSRNGVIQRWNLLSKIFGALNFYDLFRGKIDFARTGLQYTRMGAEFKGTGGIFRTENFLLDSPSMVLTGKGQLDLNSKQVQGTIQVSPLVAVDRTLARIPLIRDLLKEPDQGFLYVSYLIRGPITDPYVLPDVVGTIGGKTIEILRNILVFPREVFQ